MASVSTHHSIEKEYRQPDSSRRWSKRQLAPPGIECPHCQQRARIFFSSVHRQQPFHRRAVFAYLRCHSCTHRFRTWRLGPALLAVSTIAVALLLGIVR